MVISKMRMPASRSQATAVAAWPRTAVRTTGTTRAARSLLDQFGLGHFGNSSARNEAGGGGGVQGSVCPRAGWRTGRGSASRGAGRGHFDAACDQSVAAATPSAHCSNDRALSRSADDAAAQGPEIPAVALQTLAQAGGGRLQLPKHLTPRRDGDPLFRQRRVQRRQRPGKSAPRVLRRGSAFGRAGNGMIVPPSEARLDRFGVSGYIRTCVTGQALRSIIRQWLINHEQPPRSQKLLEYNGLTKPPQDQHHRHHHHRHQRKAPAHPHIAPTAPTTAAPPGVPSGRSRDSR